MDPSVSGYGIDTDGDGCSNLVEYALGTDPLSGRDRGYFQSIIEIGDELFLALTHQLAADDTRVEVEFSADLIHWIPSDPVAQLYISGITPEGIAESTVVDQVPLVAPDARRFVRLKITR
jgi:hypothetical protein